MATESDYNSYEALIAKSPQTCELCNQNFDNRYSSIVHNSSHIIVPLLKYQVYYCDICYIYCNTDDFTTHMSDFHHPVINNYNNDVKFNIKVPEIKLETLPQLNGGTCEVKKEIFERDHVLSSSEDETLLETVQRETERKYIQDEFKNEDEYTDFINSKLKFEVDHEYSGLLKDFSTYCEDDIQYTSNNNKNTDSETYFENKKKITTNIVYEEPVELEFDNAVPSNVHLKSDEEYESIHYSDLMRFGFLSCKYCNFYFSNRFSLIVHETSHIKIDKNCRKNLLMCPQCDKYITGNYHTVKKHQMAVHGSISPIKRERRTCKICRLKYRYYSSHIKNYHSKTNEHLEGSKNNTKDLVETVQKPVQRSFQMPIKVHIDVPIQKPFRKCEWIEKFFTIKVCDLCYSFFKNSFKKVYVLKGTVSYNTERPCDECKNVFFKLKTVRTIIRIHKSQINRGSARNTKEERLKKMQIRLKMFNKLGKCYDDLLLMFLTIRTNSKFQPNFTGRDHELTWKLYPNHHYFFFKGISEGILTNNINDAGI